MNVLIGILRALVVPLLLALLVAALLVRVTVVLVRRHAVHASVLRRAVAAGAVLIAALGVSLFAPSAPAFAGLDSGNTLAATFKRVDRAVVIVRTAGHAPGPWAGQTVMISGIGSGALISADGFVLTAAHVVQTADAVAVEFTTGEIVRAVVAASDAAADVALLKLEAVPAGAVPVRLGDSDRVDVGDQIFVIGAPLGMSHTLSVGHVSARRDQSTNVGTLASAELFQTDAAINQGNSGGPMFNLTGEVIGVVSHIVSRSGGSEGLGFAVTSNAARRLVVDEPSVWTGMEGFLLTNEIAAAFNVPRGASGLLVQRIAANSPAHRFGLRAGSLPIAVGENRLLIGGDIILAVEDIAIGASDAYETIRRRLITQHAAGQPIRLTVLRNGETLELTESI